LRAPSRNRSDRLHLLKRVGKSAGDIQSKIDAIGACERPQDLRFRETLGKAAKVQGKSGVADKSRPLAGCDRRRKNIGLEIIAGYLEATESFRLVYEKRLCLEKIKKK
jgi:hypothetical protein